MVDAKNFGERLTKCMENKGISNTELTKTLNLSKNAVGNYKNNQIPNATILYQISQILGTTMEYLLTGKDIKNLTEEEMQLLRAYHESEFGIQKAVKKILDIKENSTDMERLSNSRTG